MNAKRIVFLIGGIGVVVAGAVFLSRDTKSVAPELAPPPVAAPPQTAPIPDVVVAVGAVDAKPDAQATTPATPVAEVPPKREPTARPSSPEATEREIMDKLHALASSNPEQSLKLARDGNRRFKHSAGAPERASVIVRSLSSLGRHDEARVEALKMEKDYPQSEWTSDVHRHMFVNPPDHPGERGHGKTLELE